MRICTMTKKTLAAVALITSSGAALAGAPAFTDVDTDANQDGVLDEAE